jgi:hypothetical protein
MTRSKHVLCLLKSKAMGHLKTAHFQGRSGKLIACRSIAGVACFLALVGCHSSKRPTTSSTQTDQAIGAASLSASPNPVPAGSPDQELGKTTISWNTGDSSVGDVYVKMNRAPEVLVGRGQSGTIQINWIGFDSLYEFRLYTKRNHFKPLKKLEVIRDE